MQVLPLDPMCASVKNGMTQAWKQHVAAMELAQTATRQLDGRPLSSTETLEIDNVTHNPLPSSLRKVNRSISFEPPAPELLLRESADSDDNIEATLTHKFAGNLNGQHTRRMYSLPVENHMSTQDLLSAEQRRASSSEIRLNIRP